MHSEVVHSSWLERSMIRKSNGRGGGGVSHIRGVQLEWF